MVDPESPRTWTKEYVSTHYADCLLFLREINLMTARSIDEGRFFKALISLDEILDAFTVFKSSGRYGDVRRCLSIYSCAAAELTAFTDPEEMTREAVSYGIKPKTGLAAAGENLLKTAVGGFLDARDFAASREWRSCMNSVAKELKAGVPAGQVRLKYFQDFPDDIREDGTCQYAERSYVRSDTGLSAFQATWSLAEADETQGSYSFDGGEKLWILTGIPGVTAEDELNYRCELGGGLLQLWDEEEKCRYCCYATDADAGDEEMLITGLSEQSRQLCGEWAAARRTADDTIETTSYIFLENGAFDLRPGVFTKGIHQPELTGWQQDWADDPAYTDGNCVVGTYTFDGTNLVRTIQGAGGMDADTWEDWTEVHTVGGDLTETLELDGVKYAVLDERLGDWGAVWDALGVDHSVD